MPNPIETQMQVPAAYKPLIEKFPKKDSEPKLSPVQEEVSQDPRSTVQIAQLASMYIKGLLQD